MDRNSNKGKDPVAVELGKRGGNKIVELRGVGYMAELSKKAMQARLKKGQIKKIPGIN